MGLKKGQTNNPAGRPPNERALTKLLQQALSRSTYDTEGNRVARKKLMARLVAQGLAEGKIEFPDGREVELSAQQWIELVERMIKHIDGPAPASFEHKHTGNVFFSWDIPIPTDTEEI
jgi:hypothetical protein